MFCLDTNIVVFALNRRRPEFAVRISEELRAGRPLMIPAIVRYELEYGFAKSARPAANRQLLRTLLARGFEQPGFDLADAVEAGEIRADLEGRGTPIGPYDYLIAAQARRRGAAVVTLNLRAFGRVPGLAVMDWTA